VSNYVPRAAAHEKKQIDFRKRVNFLYSEYRKACFEEEQGIKKDVYSGYLTSPEWKAKRDSCLRRDNYLCQGCLKAEAAIAHHLTYENIFDELLFQLVSLCRACHDKIHAKGDVEIERTKQELE
jgi:hypothetical protein